MACSKRKESKNVHLIGHVTAYSLVRSTVDPARMQTIITNKKGGYKYSCVCEGGNTLLRESSQLQTSLFPDQPLRAPPWHQGRRRRERQRQCNQERIQQPEMRRSGCFQCWPRWRQLRR